MTAVHHSPIMSERDLATLGLQQLAYIKPVKVGDTAAYAVHAADGTEIAVMADRDIAMAAVRQHDLDPVSVH